MVILRRDSGIHSILNFHVFISIFPPPTCFEHLNGIYKVIFRRANNPVAMSNQNLIIIRFFKTIISISNGMKHNKLLYFSESQYVFRVRSCIPRFWKTWRFLRFMLFKIGSSHQFKDLLSSISPIHVCRSKNRNFGYSDIPENRIGLKDHWYFWKSYWIFFIF